MIGSRKATLGRSQEEREQGCPGKQAREEAHQDEGAQLIDEDNAHGQPPEDRVGTRGVDRQAGDERRRARFGPGIRAGRDGSSGPCADRGPREERHDARPDGRDEGEEPLEGEDRLVTGDG